MAENSNGPAWRKSRYCGNSTCVEVATATDAVLVRDSKDPADIQLRFSKADWRAFVTDLRSGTLPPPC
jgi:hypothetical protein